MPSVTHCRPSASNVCVCVRERCRRHMCISTGMLCGDVCVCVHTCVYERGPLHRGLCAQTDLDKCMQKGAPCVPLWTKPLALTDQFSFLKALLPLSVPSQDDCLSVAPCPSNSCCCKCTSNRQARVMARPQLHL